MYDLLIIGGTIVNHDGTNEGDIGIKDGKIAAIGSLAGQQADKVLKADNLHVLPGVIDTQVHFREPGLTHKEDLETGSRAAVKGGVTAVFEMPNTNPSTTTVEAIADKVERGRNRMFCDFALYAGASTDNIDQLAQLERAPGFAALKYLWGLPPAIYWSQKMRLCHACSRPSQEERRFIQKMKHVCSKGLASG